MQAVTYNTIQYRYYCLLSGYFYPFQVTTATIYVQIMLVEYQWYQIALPS